MHKQFQHPSAHCFDLAACCFTFLFQFPAAEGSCVLPINNHCLVNIVEHQAAKEPYIVFLLGIGGEQTIAKTRRKIGYYIQQGETHLKMLMILCVSYSAFTVYYK